MTWSGGKIGPGEFLDFPVSLETPEEPQTLTFKTIQTYDNGDVGAVDRAAGRRGPCAAGESGCRREREHYGDSSRIDVARATRVPTRSRSSR